MLSLLFIILNLEFQRCRKWVATTSGGCKTFCINEYNEKTVDLNLNSNPKSGQHEADLLPSGGLILQSMVCYWHSWSHLTGLDWASWFRSNLESFFSSSLSVQDEVLQEQQRLFKNEGFLWAPDCLGSSPVLPLTGWDFGPAVSLLCALISSLIQWR